MFPIKSTEIRWLLEAGFTESGHWGLTVEGDTVFHGSAPKQGGVYAYAVDGHVSYVGSAQRGLHSRLRHYVSTRHRRTAFRVRSLITEALRSGKKVCVLTITPELIEWRGLPIDPILGLEEGLIRHIQPEWNLRGLGRTSIASANFANLN